MLKDDFDKSCARLREMFKEMSEKFPMSDWAYMYGLDWENVERVIAAVDMLQGARTMFAAPDWKENVKNEVAVTLCSWKHDPYTERLKVFPAEQMAQIIYGADFKAKAKKKEEPKKEELSAEKYLGYRYVAIDKDDDVPF